MYSLSAKSAKSSASATRRTSSFEPGPSGQRLEVRRVAEADDFADFKDNEYIQKEAVWREELGKP